MKLNQDIKMKNKIKIKIEPPKPRNPFVSLAMNLKAGTHEKPQKTMRAKLKIQLKKEVSSEFDK